MTDMPEKRRSPSILYWIFTIVIILMLGISIVLNLGLGAALALLSPGLVHDDDHAVDEFPVFEEEWSYGAGDVKAVRLELTGLITRESESGWLEAPVDKIENLLRAIRAATHDDDVRAIILEVDTPGGGITESDELYRELMRFRASAEGRAVVIHMRDLAASGGYYVAMAGNWLVAQPTTVLGSIGVIMQSLNWKGLSERIGVTDTTIKSGENKDLLNPFRESDPEQLAMLQEMIDRMHERFRMLVSHSRGLDAARLDALADGRIFTSDQALDAGLIDQLGYWDDVVTKTAELAGVETIKVVRYYQHENILDYMLGVTTPVMSRLRGWSSGTPRLQYLWRP